jgi:hypothetical protein
MIKNRGQPKEAETEDIEPAYLRALQCKIAPLTLFFLTGGGNFAKHMPAFGFIVFFSFAFGGRLQALFQGSHCLRALKRSHPMFFGPFK